MSLSQQDREKLNVILRRGLMSVVYCAMFFASAIGIVIISRQMPLPVENWIEIYQEAMLVTTAGVFFSMARRIDQERGGLLLIAGFFTCLFIRECDAFFDPISHSFWQLILVGFLVPLLYFVRRAGLQTSIEGVYRFVSSNQFLLLCVGVIMVVVFSRMFGAHWLWSMYLDHYESFRISKRLVEETLELLGYMLCATAAIGYSYERRNG